MPQTLTPWALDPSGVKWHVKDLHGVKSPKEGKAFQITPSLWMKGHGICGGWQNPFSSYQRGRLKEDRLDVGQRWSEVSEHANSSSVRADIGRKMKDDCGLASPLLDYATWFKLKKSLWYFNRPLQGGKVTLIENTTGRVGLLNHHLH